ncbi:unnamed protein product [Rotaria sordida]|uniref:Uncharacterized protein n=1 Tax=Rotaria sordida TaxID=392033 RepID=A0A820FD58_9BILA|nr:unnamed protein product [Rotaria sordida]
MFNALTLGIILFEISSLVIGPLIDRFGCRFQALALIAPGRDSLLYVHRTFSSLAGIMILLTAYSSSGYFTKSRAFVSALFAGACTSATIILLLPGIFFSVTWYPWVYYITQQNTILSNKYTFAYNLSTIAAIIICPLNGFLLGFMADRSKKQKLCNISLMQTISWLLNIVACIVCMFVQTSMIIPALVINCIRRATIVGGSQAVIATL